MLKFVILAVAAWLAFSVYYISWPYQLSASDLQIGDRRSPEENRDLIAQVCAAGSKSVCECVTSAIYSRTSRFERAVYLYADSWIWAWSVRAGARSIGIGDADLAKVPQQVRDKIASMIAGCKK